MPLSEVQPKSGPLPDTKSGIEELRGLYRPERVRLLLVGESSPAGGTHFYLANSNLFQATREAFVLALDETGIPSGGGFLEFFRDAGGWLVDLADRPVNHLSNSERRRIVNAGVPRLTRTIDETGPDNVVAVGKTFVGSPVHAAVHKARRSCSVSELPFPLYAGKTQYVQELAGIVAALQREPE